MAKRKASSLDKDRISSGEGASSQMAGILSAGTLGLVLAERELQANEATARSGITHDNQGHEQSPTDGVERTTFDSSPAPGHDATAGSAENRLVDHTAASNVFEAREQGDGAAYFQSSDLTADATSAGPEWGASHDAVQTASLTDDLIPAGGNASHSVESISSHIGGSAEAAVTSVANLATDLLDRTMDKASSLLEVGVSNLQGAGTYLSGVANIFDAGISVADPSSVIDQAVPAISLAADAIDTVAPLVENNPLGFVGQSYLEHHEGGLLHGFI